MEPTAARRLAPAKEETDRAVAIVAVCWWVGGKALTIRKQPEGRGRVARRAAGRMGTDVRG